MSGTTLCPHCDTRFKISETQLEAHHGMVRCGHCLQAFDARPGFVPDQPSPQLELPILDEPAADITDETPSALIASEEIADDSFAAVTDGEADILTDETADTGSAVSNEIIQPDNAHNETLDYIEMISAAQGEVQLDAPPLLEIEPMQPMTLAERVAIVQDENDSESRPKRRTWPWAIAAFLLLLALLAQAAYFFRVDLAAHLPALKPALASYCQLLKCTVPLPQNANLMSIESSDLEAVAAHENQIVLNVVLRNRAPYSQTFPNLELTLNDTRDAALARRIFRPVDYLPPIESEELGLLPHHEINIKLHLDTTDLRPTGYRLALLYP